MGRVQRYCLDSEQRSERNKRRSSVLVLSQDITSVREALDAQGERQRQRDGEHRQSRSEVWRGGHPLVPRAVTPPQHRPLARTQHDQEVIMVTIMVQCLQNARTLGKLNAIDRGLRCALSIRLP